MDKPNSSSEEKVPLIPTIESNSNNTQETITPEVNLEIEQQIKDQQKLAGVSDFPCWQ